VNWCSRGYNSSWLGGGVRVGHAPGWAVGNRGSARGDGASAGLGGGPGQNNWVRGGVGYGRARWAVGDGGSARCDSNNIGDIGGALGHDGTSEESGNNGETHLN